MNKKKQKRQKGDVIKIALGDDSYGFGIVLQDPLVGFYDIKAMNTPSIEEIISHKIIFKLWVMNYAIANSIFKIIGHIELTDDLKENPLFYKQDLISGKLSITNDGSDEKTVFIDECDGLECAAIWDPEHVVSRLNNYFLQREDPFSKSLAININKYKNWLEKQKK